MIFEPKAPPMSGAITSTLNSGRPKIRASPFLIGSGAWVEIHALSVPARASNSATTPRVSMGLPQLRSIHSRSRSTRAARAKAASGSPTRCTSRPARLAGTSACTSGDPSASAASSSVTAGSGS